MAGLRFLVPSMKVRPLLPQPTRARLLRSRRVDTVSPAYELRVIIHITMKDQWRTQLNENSGNLTTNAPMPSWIIDKLLEDDESATNKIAIDAVTFPELEGALGKVNGLHIIKALQEKNRSGYLTVFRAIRFPTNKRLLSLLSEGFIVSNYEQERILELYKDENYIQQRTKNQNDERFWTQPQERVVHGIPVFALVNDALQIHRAFRGAEDKVAIAAIHIPREHLENGKIKLIANTAIDLDYQNADRDIPVRDFREKSGIFEIDYAAMRARGVDLHEMYSQDLPLSKAESDALGIEQEFYLLDIYEIDSLEPMNSLEADTKLLRENKHFLHGLFGDQNIFGRRKAKYLPSRCYSLKLKEIMGTHT